MNKFILSILCGLSFGTLFAQETETHETSNHTERTAVYELIVSGIYAYDPSTKHGLNGTEIHFTYWFNHVWGAGLGYTALFGKSDEVIHQLALLGSWNPTTWLTINAGPSFLLPNEHTDLQLSGYLETEFNYRLREWIHFGPVVGSVVGEQTEINVGFQLGFEF